MRFIHARNFQSKPDRSGSNFISFSLTNALTFTALLVLLTACSAGKQPAQEGPPNVVLIMADDMGYECLSAYGSLSYKTPILDSLAAQGILFMQAHSQPLCTPTRVKIMTGMYNYRNYDFFGNLDNDEYTFGQLMKEAGYATCVAGKWQLNGLHNPEEVPDCEDPSKPVRFGFDEYCLWQLIHHRREGERFANPLIVQNGETLERDPDAYGPDIFADYILDFIERKKDSSFFVYYPMVLVHNPFVPTPDSEEWADPSRRYEDDTTYYRDMMEYTDKIVGRIADKLEALDLAENTILIFTADNGTNMRIYTKTREGVIRGAKGKTIDHGTHVPLIVYWPGHAPAGMRYGGLVEFSDFFTTLADMVGSDVPSDGQSLLPLISGKEHTPRESIFIHYDPRWGRNADRRNQFARSGDYKLYQDDRFFNVEKDRLEEQPLDKESLNPDQERMLKMLQSEFERHPEWNPDPE